MTAWYDQQMPLDYRFTFRINGREEVIWRPGAREGAEHFDLAAHWAYANTAMQRQILSSRLFIIVAGFSVRPFDGADALQGDITRWINLNDLETFTVEVL